MGSIIGHELSHSLDPAGSKALKRTSKIRQNISRGRQADSNGVLRKWWPNADIAQYQLKSKCFELYANKTESVLLIVRQYRSRSKLLGLQKIRQHWTGGDFEEL